jgi:hypothetical protein
MNKKHGFAVVVLVCLFVPVLVFTACQKDDSGPNVTSADLESQWTNYDDFEGLGLLPPGQGMEPYQTYSFYKDDTYLIWNPIKGVIAEEGTYKKVVEAGEVTIFINTKLDFEAGIDEWEEYELDTSAYYEMTVTKYENAAFDLSPPPAVKDIPKYRGYVVTGQEYDSYTAKDSVFWVISWHKGEEEKYQTGYIKE